MVPVTDGKRVFNLRCDLRSAVASECRSIIKEWHKALMLVTIDELWKEHLRELDQLRQSVQNAAYEQKDPLVIYKVESFHLFETMLANLNNKAVAALMRGQIFMRQPAPQQDAASQMEKPAPKQPDIKETHAEQRRIQPNYKTTRTELPGTEAQRQAASAQQGEREKPMPVKAGPRVGRNDPCPCGSGKKYKNCHGRGDRKSVV